MIVIRPIALSDLNALHQIAIDSGHGLTSLPDNKAFLAQRIKQSIDAFASQTTTVSEQSYLFVMQHTLTGVIIGTSGIEACVGLTTPLYHHRIETSEQSLSSHNIHTSLQTLTLCTDLSAGSEICSLYLRPEYRKDGNGRALSRFRFLFMAEHASRFTSTIIAEMRGYTDEDGRSPFWEWFEQQFCDIDFETSNQMISAGDMRFIQALMPKHPIYTHLMSAEAQQAINKVHRATEPAMALLAAENFNCGEYIGVNDAGPAMVCKLSDIKTVLESSLKTVSIGYEQKNSTHYLASNTQLVDYRAALIEATIQADIVIINKTTALILGVSDGDKLRLVAK